MDRGSAGTLCGTFNGLNQLTNRAGGGQILLEGTISKPSTVSVGGSNVALNAKNFKTKINVNTGTNSISIVATAKDANNQDITTSRTAQIVVTGTASQAFSYDDNGNLLSDGNRTFTWDACNRLASIQYADSTQTAFTYDGQSRRVQIKEISASGTSTKNLLWNGNQICEERDGDNNVTKRYYQRGMQLVSGSNAGSYYYTLDHLGSIREVTNANRAVQTRYDYDPYGRKTATKVSGNIDADFGYTGDYYHAPSALCLTLYRAYDADTARWLSRDPLADPTFGISNGVVRSRPGEMIVGPNLYEYVSNEPTRKIDPTGLIPAIITVPCSLWKKSGCQCVYECRCPSGYTDGFMSAFVTQPCKLPAPTRTCVSYESIGVGVAIVGVSVVAAVATGGASLAVEAAF